MQPDPFRLRLSALVGFLAVGLGAMGAHALHDRLVAAGGLEHWQTAAAYQLPHAVLLVILALMGRVGGALTAWSWRCTLAGIAGFSGSLYVIAALQPKTWQTGWLKSLVFAATPLGGLLLLAGWLLLILAAGSAHKSGK